MEEDDDDDDELGGAVEEVDAGVVASLLAGAGLTAFLRLDAPTCGRLRIFQSPNAKAELFRPPYTHNS